MDLRPITPEEIEPFYATFFRTMGFPPPNDEQRERDKKAFLCDRSIAAFDAGSVVGTTYSYPLDLTLPGGSRVSTAGVTAVSVAPTHRRQGVVTQLMRDQLTDARERGEPAAVLVASEGRIYGRFGYGVATQVSDVTIHNRDAQLPARSGGRVVIVDGETADKTFPLVREKICATRAGSIGRPPHFWESLTAGREKGWIHLVHENAGGEADGYARYEQKSDWNDGLPNGKATVHELNALTDDASFELWRFLFNLDLVREISAWSRPVDEPMRWALAEPRAIRANSVRDMYWVRPLDVCELLSNRTYNIEIELRLKISDALLGFGGTFDLKGGPDGAECSPSSGSVDLRMSISDLGSIWLGGIAPTELARAGRIEEVTPGALRRADAAFVVYPKPWGDQYF